MFILIVLASRCISLLLKKKVERSFLSTKQLKQLERDGIMMFSLMASLSIENQVAIGKLQVVCDFP